MATWILTLAAASLVVSKLPKTKHSNPFNMSVSVASIYGIPTHPKKKQKTSPKYVYFFCTNGPSIAGCPNGSLIYRNKPSIHRYTSLGFVSPMGNLLAENSLPPSIKPSSKTAATRKRLQPPELAEAPPALRGISPA